MLISFWQRFTLSLCALSLAACSGMESYHHPEASLSNQHPDVHDPVTQDPPIPKGPPEPPYETPGAPSPSPFDSVMPSQEIWVASYGEDYNPGTLFQPMRTIYAALRQATPGTAIMVKAGSYREYLLVPSLATTASKPVWLRSADGMGAAKITPILPDKPSIRVMGTANVVIEGFHISGGVEIYDATRTVVQNNILAIGNLVMDGAIGSYILSNEFQAGSDFEVYSCQNCLFQGNSP